MRIVIMGTGPFAVPTFRALLASDHEIVELISRPPRQARGKRRPPLNPMRAAAEGTGLAVLMPEDINAPDAVEALREFAADLMVVCDYGQILSGEALSVAPLGGINLHASLLPRYRGAAPINWALYEGETETGVSVIHMTPRLDAGPCLTIRRTPIEPTETAVELEQRLSLLGVEAVLESIDILAAAGPGAEGLGTPQDAALATRAPRLKKSDGIVDWTRTARQIHCQVRALQPWPRTCSRLHRGDSEPLPLILDQVAVVDQPAEGMAPGSVHSCATDHFLVATGDGLLALEVVQPAGKRSMPIADFLRGHRVRAGDRFLD